MSGQYFAQLDSNKKVINVAVVTREFLEANPDRYQGVWVETFFDRPDKTYAWYGMTYDETKQDFIVPTVSIPEK